MEAASGIREPRKRLEVRGADFFQLAVAQDGVDDGMSAGKFLKRLLTRGKLPASGLFGLGQAKFREEQFAELLGGADVERSSGLGVDLLRKLLQLIFHFTEKSPEGRHIDGYAFPFHIGQHRHEREFQPRIERSQPVALKAQNVTRRESQGQGAHAETAPAETGIGNLREAGQPLPRVIAVFGIKEVRGQAKIEEPPALSGAAGHLLLPVGGFFHEALGVSHHNAIRSRSPAGQRGVIAAPREFLGTRRGDACSSALLHGHAGASVRTVWPDDSHGTSGYGGQRGRI